MSWKIAALGLVLVVAAGAGGFTARQATSSSHSSFRNGYRSGLADGRSQGDQSGQQRGYADGHAAAARDGRAALRTANRSAKQATDDAFNAGWKSAFEGFDGGWTAGSYYIVKVGSTSDGKDNLDSRIAVKPNTVYITCSDGPGICGAPLSDFFSGATTTPPSTVPPIEPSPSGPSGTTTYPGIGSPVICVDGTLSYSGGRPGACSHHGGEP